MGDRVSFVSTEALQILLDSFASIHCSQGKYCLHAYGTENNSCIWCGGEFPKELTPREQVWLQLQKDLQDEGSIQLAEREFHGRFKHISCTLPKDVVVAFSGSRMSSTLRRLMVNSCLITLMETFNKLQIQVGDCSTGVDSYVKNTCVQYGIPHQVLVADWSKGKKAGPLRNGEVIKGAHLLIALKADFGEGESKGTTDCIQQAMDAGIPVIVYERKLQYWK